MRDRPSGGGRRPASPRPPQPPSQEHANLRYPIPSASANAWRAWRGADKGICNPGLVFDRFAPDWRERSDKNGRDEKARRNEPPIKQRGLQEVIKAAERRDDKLLAAYQTRWQAIALAVGARPFTLRSDWRLITGLGRHGPLEVGFRFDRYGFPILPGSGLKGLARTAALVELAERVEALPLGQVETALVGAGEALSRLGRAERQRAVEDAAWWQRALAAQGVTGADRAVDELAADFHAVFGTVGAAGGAVFLDAIPAEAPRLALDIMNPHYPQYYQSNGTLAPTDWQSPVPVYFLTVAAGVPFRFAVGWRGPRDAAAEARRQRAEGWLRRGLTELGAGAKTSAGYGYFQAVPAAPERPAAATATEQPRGPVAAGAPPASAGTTPAPPQRAVPRVTRRGTIAWIRPDLRRGCVRDNETGQEYRFGIEVVKGNTPANKGQVEFDLEGDRVVRVQRV